MADHRAPISCVMKVVVAWLVLYAECEGKLDITEDIGRYIPQLCQRGEQVTGISLVHLLTHTAGYIEPQQNSARWGFSLDQFLEFFPKRKQAFQPGTVWSYTHTGHALLQVVLEKVFNRPLHDLVREVLFDPLGFELLFMSEGQAVAGNMMALHVKMPRDGAYMPMRPPLETGFLRYSISDAVLSCRELAKLGAVLAGGYVKKLPHLEKARKSLLTNAISLPAYCMGAQGERMPKAFCYGVADYGAFKGINGSYVGSTCALRFYEQQKLGMAVMVNAYEPHVRDVTARMLGQPFAQLVSEATPTTEIFENPQVLAGHYEGLMLGLEDAEIIWDGRYLNCSVRFKRDGGVSARFTRDNDGRLVLAEGSRNASLAFASNPAGGEPYLMVSTSAFRKVA